MSGFGQRSGPWPGYPTPMPSESEPIAAAADARGEESTLKNFGTSVDAISFGFAATAILISLFLFMAIFEHLIKPRAFLSGTPASTPHRGHHHRHGQSPGKVRSPPKVRIGQTQQIHRSSCAIVSARYLLGFFRLDG
jgi:hypothetical protein